MSALEPARREAVRNYAAQAEAHLDRGDMSLAVQQLVYGLRAVASEPPAPPLRAPVEPDQSFRHPVRLPLSTDEQPRAPRRASVRVQRNSKPTPCTDCGPDVSPHLAELWLVWGEGSARQFRAVCVTVAGRLQLNAISQIESAQRETTT